MSRTDRKRIEYLIEAKPELDSLRNDAKSLGIGLNRGQYRARRPLKSGIRHAASHEIEPRKRIGISYRCYQQRGMCPRRRTAQDARSSVLAVNQCRRTGEHASACYGRAARLLAGRACCVVGRGRTRARTHAGMGNWYSKKGDAQRVPFACRASCYGRWRLSLSCSVLHVLHVARVALCVVNCELARSPQRVVLLRSGSRKWTGAVLSVVIWCCPCVAIVGTQKGRTRRPLLLALARFAGVYVVGSMGTTLLSVPKYADSALLAAPLSVSLGASPRVAL